jgi:hypothetical protein
VLSCSPYQVHVSEDKESDKGSDDTVGFGEHAGEKTDVCTKNKQCADKALSSFWRDMRYKSLELVFAEHREVENSCKPGAFVSFVVELSGSE